MRQSNKEQVPVAVSEAAAANEDEDSDALPSSPPFLLHWWNNREMHTIETHEWETVWAAIRRLFPMSGADTGSCFLRRRDDPTPGTVANYLVVAGGVRNDALPNEGDEFVFRAGTTFSENHALTGQESSGAFENDDLGKWCF